MSFLFLRNVQVKNLFKTANQISKLIKSNIHNGRASDNKNFVDKVQKSSFFAIFRKRSAEQLKVRDDVPDVFNLIYRNPMDKYLIMSQVVTTVTGTVLFIYYSMNLDVKPRLPTEQFSNKPRPVENEIFVYITTFIGLILILQTIIARTPVRVYKSQLSTDYQVIIRGTYPLTTKKVLCTGGDLQPMGGNYLAPVRDSLFRLKSNTIIMFEEYFRRPGDLYVMLGVQRDPDLE